MSQFPITHRAKMPDPLKISRYRKAPELGPAILFFSGGSALTGVSRSLKSHTHNSIHLVTPFDSGGSSAKLRNAFNMPSIGDLRSRLMALADESVTGHPEIYQLFTHRFAKNAPNILLEKQLNDIANGKHPLSSEISNPMRRLICNQLGWFIDAAPEDFDLRGASLGNLILAGGYLNNHQHLDPSIFLFSQLVNVQGTVRAVVYDHLHLGADLEDGRQVIGQHLLTGKETAPLSSPVKRLFLSSNPKADVPTATRIRKNNRKLIKNADLICYPPGSFYTSLIANLLPAGVGNAIADNGNPKVYVPNLGTDPEQIGMDLNRCMQTLLTHLRADSENRVEISKVLNFILIDERSSGYPGQFDTNMLEKLGITLIKTRLTSKRSVPYYDDELLVSALLSLT